MYGDEQLPFAAFLDGSETKKRLVYRGRRTTQPTDPPRQNLDIVRVLRVAIVVELVVSFLSFNHSMTKKLLLRTIRSSIHVDVDA